MLTILLAAPANAASTLIITYSEEQHERRGLRKEREKQESSTERSQKTPSFTDCDSEQPSVALSSVGPLSSTTSTPRIRNTAAKGSETHGKQRWMHNNCVSSSHSGSRTARQTQGCGQRHADRQSWTERKLKL